MLWQRLFFGALLIAALVGLIYGDDALSLSGGDAPVKCFWNGLIVVVILVVLVLLGGLELRKLFRAAGHAPLMLWPLTCAVALVAIPYAACGNCMCGAIHPRAMAAELTPVVLTIGFLGTCCFVAARRRIDGAVADIALSMFIVLYLGLLPQYLVRIRMFGPPGAVWLLLYFVGTVKFCDIGAYFTGMAIGRHKLIVWLSPKKTWEGLIGGLATSAGVAMLVSHLVRTHSADLSPLAAAFPDLPKAAVFGLLMGLVGQGGDLLESLIKRGAQAKDSAKAIPAFGGVLDIIDSLLPTAPIAYWMLVQ